MEENDTEVFAPKGPAKEPSLNWTSLLLLLILLTLVAFGSFYFGKGRKEIPTPSLQASPSASPL